MKLCGVAGINNSQAAEWEARARFQLLHLAAPFRWLRSPNDVRIPGPIIPPWSPPMVADRLVKRKTGQSFPKTGNDAGLIVAEVERNAC
jgi:hypothetical protein